MPGDSAIPYFQSVECDVVGIYRKDVAKDAAPIHDGLVHRTQGSGASKTGPGIHTGLCSHQSNGFVDGDGERLDARIVHFTGNVDRSTSGYGAQTILDCVKAIHLLQFRPHLHWSIPEPTFAARQLGATCDTALLGPEVRKANSIPRHHLLSPREIPRKGRIANPVDQSAFLEIPSAQGFSRDETVSSSFYRTSLAP